MWLSDDIALANQEWEGKRRLTAVGQAVCLATVCASSAEAGRDEGSVGAIGRGAQTLGLLAVRPAARIV